MTEELIRSSIKILLIEDNPGDVRLVKEMLYKEEAKVDLAYATRLEEGLKYLGENVCDIILLDLNLPDSNGFETFLEVHKRNPDMPVIILTGLDDKELGLEAVRKGAQDYLVKGKFDGKLLIRSISYSIERQKLLLQLEKTMKELKALKGILPICSFCKKIRDDKGYWNQLEAYISEHSEAEFSHGMCPECAKKWREEWEKTKGKMKNTEAFE
jgi:PleD family two-component response regulator